MPRPTRSRRGLLLVAPVSRSGVRGCFDIAPFLAVLRSGTLDGYDVVLKLHSKRSTHLFTGETRRRLLYEFLAGHPRQVRRILALFADARVGLVGWGGSLRLHPRHWGKNQQRVEGLWREFAAAARAPDEAALQMNLAYFEGSMFWFRPAALAPLRKLGLSVEDFEAEEGQVDGALQHALERTPIQAAAFAGYARGDFGIVRPLMRLVDGKTIAAHCNAVRPFQTSCVAQVAQICEAARIHAAGSASLLRPGLRIWADLIRKPNRRIAEAYRASVMDEAFGLGRVAAPEERAKRNANTRINTRIRLLVRSAPWPHALPLFRSEIGVRNAHLLPAYIRLARLARRMVRRWKSSNA